MRISDWSSDVCSSDLELCQAGRSGHAPEASADHHCARHALNPSGCPATVRAGEVRRERSGGTEGARVPSLPPSPGLPDQAGHRDEHDHSHDQERSEERRAGKECVGTWRYRLSPAHKNKEATTNTKNKTN